MRTPGFLVLVFVGLAACGGKGVGADAGPPDADTCSNLAPLPVVPETILGFTGAEDFAFDDQGNYVAVDFNGDLVAISRDGMRRVLVPGAGGEAGTAFLPDGDLVINQASTGSILRISLDSGSVVPVISGLLYPNGLDVGLDGFIYVAENGSTRVRRVDPDTGEFTIVAVGLVSPNGVAFGPDPNKLYIGSFGGGVAYEIDLSTPTLDGRSRVFGRMPGVTTPEPTPPCIGQVAGDPCDVDAFGTPGECTPFGGVLDCQPVNPCEGLNEGDPCQAPFVINGACTDIGGGVLACTEAPQCTTVGEPCNAFGVPGECVLGDFGIQCVDIACRGVPDGGQCVDPYGLTGTCMGEWPAAYCWYQDPCALLLPDDPCTTDGGVPGTCTVLGFTYACAAPPGCDGFVAGEPCIDPAGIGGHCVGDPAVCQADDTCIGLAAGDDCLLDVVVHGVCVDAGGMLSCERRNPCDTLPLGSSCSGLGPTSGTCVDTGGGAECVTYLTPMFEVCEGSTVGAACSIDVDGHVFTATCLDTKGALYCDVKEDYAAPCVGLSAGDACEGASPFFGVYDGTCQAGFGGLECWQTGVGGGALDGINVDVCGNVYVTEFGPGTIWRFSPDGESVIAAQTGSGWIPNMHWGTGLGGFERDVLYVADRDRSGLFGLHLGVPGPRQPFP